MIKNRGLRLVRPEDERHERALTFRDRVREPDRTILFTPPSNGVVAHLRIDRLGVEQGSSTLHPPRWDAFKDCSTGKPNPLELGWGGVVLRHPVDRGLAHEVVMGSSLDQGVPVHRECRPAVNLREREDEPSLRQLRIPNQLSVVDRLVRVNSQLPANRRPVQDFLGGTQVGESSEGFRAWNPRGCCVEVRPEDPVLDADAVLHHVGD